MDQVPAGRTYPHDGRIPETALLPDHLPTDANFFLTRVTDANAIYNYLVHQGIIVRNRTHVSLCHDCLRITIGTRPENNALLEALREYKA